MTDNNVKQLREMPVLSPPQLLQQALASGAGIDVIDKLLSAQERWEHMQAKKAFNKAIARFKADPDRPAILKNVEVNFESRGGLTSYKHADLADMLAAVDPALAKHGLWVRFKINSAEKVTVRCILGHEDGYSEEASELSCLPDNSGGKNPIQAIGSAVTYLQKYTLGPALGLAAAKDDDGRAAGQRSDMISDQRASDVKKFNEIQSLLQNFSDKAVETFLKTAGALTVNDIQPVKYDSCINYLNRQLAAKEAKGKK